MPEYQAVQKSNRDRQQVETNNFNIRTGSMMTEKSTITVEELVEKAGLQIYCGADKLKTGVTGGYASDLLSDVMGNAREGQVWITLQSHLNVVAIASLKELSAVVLVKDIRPDEAVLVKAVEEGIPLLGSALPAFETAGKIFELLNKE